MKFSDVLGTFQMFDNVVGEVVIPLAKLAGSGTIGVQGWFRLLGAGSLDTIPGDDPENMIESAPKSFDGDHNHGESSVEKNKHPSMELPQIHLTMSFSPNVISSDTTSQSDVESSKVICKEGKIRT